MNLRFKFVFVFVFVFVLKAPPSAALAANFSDVPEAHKNAYAIQTLKDAGVVAGYGDGTFQPDKTVSRAEASAIIMKANGIAAVKTNEKLPFSDVAEDAWYFPVIQKGVSLGKIKGYEDKTFRPNNPVNLPEALAFTLSFYQVNVKGLEIEPVIYEGLDRIAWYAPQAQYAKNFNLIEPHDDGRFDPNASLTRGDIAELIYRMRLTQQTKKPFDITTNWIETLHLENFWKLRHPADWEIFKGMKNSVIWKRSAPQVFFTRIWPASTRLSISFVENPGWDLDDLKSMYQKAYPELQPKFANTYSDGRASLMIKIPERRIIDTVIQIAMQKYLVLYGDYGEGAQGEFLKKQLELVIASYKFVEKPAEPPVPVIPLEERMETLRENILVKGKWSDVAPNFPDKKLIYTDAIGIGTGPVDYYSSKEANHTIKLERNSGTILNIREGETYAF